MMKMMGFSKGMSLVVLSVVLLASQSHGASLHKEGYDIFDLLNSTFREGVDPSFDAKVITNIIFPQYLQQFLELIQEDQTRAFEELLDGVKSPHCRGHVTEWLLRANVANPNLSKEADKWVLQMFDAWGKPPEGILSGHVNAYGDFDECVQIKVEDLVSAIDSLHTSFEGKYCTVYIVDYASAMSGTPKPIPAGTNGDVAVRDVGINSAVSLEELTHQMGIRQGIPILPTMGVCIPNSCSKSDTQQVLVNGFNIMYKLLHAVNPNPGKPPEYNPKNVVWPFNYECYEGKKPDFDAADYSVLALLGVITALCVAAGVVDYWLNHGLEKPPNRGLAFKYFMAFSLYTNIKKWKSTRVSGEDLGCLHGIRFLSTSWVVLAHTYYVITFLPQWNMVDVKTVYNDWTVLTIINSTFAVDTFFVFSGMLVAYNVFKMLDKTKGKINIPMFYLHRYLRLTPTYAILVGIMATLIPYLGNGPYWAVMTRWGHICEDNWWTNLLYVNNFVNTSWLCQGEAWYLANDMQFYIVSPFIIFPMWKWEMIGVGLLAVWTVLSSACPALLVHFLETTPTTLPTRDMGRWFTHIYIRPYSRIQTFLVGIWLGWILHKTRGKKVKLPWLVVVALWLATTAICLSCLYSIQDWFDPEKEIPEVSALLYAGLSRLGWGVAVSWIIFACLKGYGGIVNDFLSWNAFMPLGRLCYCVYLVSLHLQMILHIRFTQPMRFDGYTQMNFFFGHMVCSFIVGFFCTLLFESPFMILQKLIFEGGGPPRPRQDAVTSKRPSKRNGIFYQNPDTVINAQVTEPTEKVSQD